MSLRRADSDTFDELLDGIGGLVLDELERDELCDEDY
jgi:hypothetical protein